MTEERAKYDAGRDIPMSKLEASFLFHWRVLAPIALRPAKEHKFCNERNWHFDFAWPEQMVAVECEGGTWKQTKTGRSAGHAHPARFEKDCKKYNRATADGWRVFRCTAGMLERDPAAFVEMVLEAIKEDTK
jgi:very-short-patch-repair endonuclease